MQALVQRRTLGRDRQRRDAGCSVAAQPVLDSAAWSDQGSLVDEVQRHGSRRLTVLLGEKEILDLCGRFLEAHPDRKRVVEVLLPRSHPAQIESGVGAQWYSGHLDVIVDDHRDGWHDVEADETVPSGAETGFDTPDLQRGQQVAGVLRAEEDGQPAIGDLAGELEVLGTDSRQIDRQMLAHWVDGHPQGLAGSVWKRQRPMLALVGDGLSSQGHPDDVDVLAGPYQRRIELDPVPSLAHLRPGDPEAAPEGPARQIGRA